MNKTKIKIGLLPLYIALYDISDPETRIRLGVFAEKIAASFTERGFDVIKADICCVKDEFSRAVKSFEEGGADCIVTLHLAYSPSLESSDFLAATKLPLIVLDTTETYEFSFDCDPGELMYNHGIHGVMDMCNLLRRNGKEYAIAAGHYTESDVLDRVAGFARAAYAARSLDGMRVGSIGGSFEGMGDFLISDNDMKERFGAEVVYADAKELSSLLSKVSSSDVEAEVAADLSEFKTEGLSPDIHARTARNSLAVREWIEKEGLGAFTVNFLKIGPETGLEIMPFMEASKQMRAGIGYAGEGDVLTAAFTAAFIRGYSSASFCEIFCPDWKGGKVMLSHMGEANYSLLHDIELLETPFIYGKAENPVTGYGCFVGGEAVYVNTDGKKLIISPVTMLDVKKDSFGDSIRGWMEPHIALPEFLEKLSINGATHHSTLIYGARCEELEFFARLVGLEPVII